MRPSGQCYLSICLVVQRAFHPPSCWSCCQLTCGSDEPSFPDHSPLWILWSARCPPFGSTQNMLSRLPIQHTPTGPSPSGRFMSGLHYCGRHSGSFKAVISSSILSLLIFCVKFVPDTLPLNMSRTTEDPLKILYVRSLEDWPDLCRYQLMKVFPSPCWSLWVNLQEIEAGCSWVGSRERGVLVFTTLCLQKPPTLSLFSYVLLVFTGTKIIFPMETTSVF